MASFFVGREIYTYGTKRKRHGDEACLSPFDVHVDSADDFHADSVYVQCGGQYFRSQNQREGADSRIAGLPASESDFSGGGRIRSGN